MSLLLILYHFIFPCRVLAEYVLILTLAIFPFLQRLVCLEVMAKRKSSTTGWELK
jgi:hypothetical protein